MATRIATRLAAAGATALAGGSLLYSSYSFGSNAPAHCASSAFSESLAGLQSSINAIEKRLGVQPTTPPSGSTTRQLRHMNDRLQDLQGLVKTQVLEAEKASAPSGPGREGNRVLGGPHKVILSRWTISGATETPQEIVLNKEH